MRQNGNAIPPNTPGHGIEFDEDALDRFTVWRGQNGRDRLDKREGRERRQGRERRRELQREDGLERRSGFDRRV
jgi:hypothetical protein